MLNMLVWMQKWKHKVYNTIAHEGYMVQPNNLNPWRNDKVHIAVAFIKLTQLQSCIFLKLIFYLSAYYYV